MIPRTDIPPPWRHQAQATAWAKERLGSYFDMDMGSGKSRAYIDAQDGSRLTLVITTKKGVAHVWPGQFEDWSTRELVLIPMTKGTIAKRIERAEDQMRRAGHRPGHVPREDATPCVVICNWEMFRSKAFEQWCKKWNWEHMSGDEMHKAKSPTGTTSKAVGRVWTKVPCPRVGLSGTPMPHDPLDIWAQYRAIDPSVFGTRFGFFKARIAIMGGYQNPHTGRPTQVIGWQNLDWMKAQLAATMFQPLPEDVELDLPPTKHVQIVVPLESKSKKLYKAVEADMAVQVARGEINAANGLVKLLRLQQIASGLAVSEEVDDYGETEKFTEVVGTEKQEAIAEIIDGTRDKVTVFCVFHAELDAIRRASESVGAGCAELSGRVDQLGEWKSREDDAPRVLAVQIAAGSEGIDLTLSPHCVFMSTGFNMGLYKQALKRSHRPGQKRPVTYYHVLAEDTVDQRVYGTLLKRGDLVASALSGLRELAPV